MKFVFSLGVRSSSSITGSANTNISCVSDASTKNRAYALADEVDGLCENGLCTSCRRFCTISANIYLPICVTNSRVQLSSARRALVDMEFRMIGDWRFSRVSMCTQLSNARKRQTKANEASTASPHCTLHIVGRVKTNQDCLIESFIVFRHNVRVSELADLASLFYRIVWCVYILVGFRRAGTWNDSIMHHCSCETHFQYCETFVITFIILKRSVRCARGGLTWKTERRSGSNGFKVHISTGFDHIFRQHFANASLTV